MCFIGERNRFRKRISLKYAPGEGRKRDRYAEHYIVIDCVHSESRVSFLHSNLQFEQGETRHSSWRCMKILRTSNAKVSNAWTCFTRARGGLFRFLSKKKRSHDGTCLYLAFPRLELSWGSCVSRSQLDTMYVILIPLLLTIDK